MNFKDIHIGSLLLEKVTETGIPMERILKNFTDKEEDAIMAMYEAKSIDTELLLKWCKLLRHDFFRYYSQHLILYKPQEKNVSPILKNTESPSFIKQIYTKEIIDFILELIRTGKKTKSEVMEEYNIPKTTLFRWLRKYSPPKSPPAPENSGQAPEGGAPNKLE